MSRPDDQSGGFLGRWARLKQEARRAPPASEAVPTVETTQEPGKPNEDLPLPSLDSIVPGGDVSAFFQAHVPEALRTAALRKLWTTDPEISGFIEMADYQWDFNNPDAIPGWGSKLDTPDIRRLAERLLGGGEAESGHPMGGTIAGNARDQQNSGEANAVAGSLDMAQPFAEQPQIASAENPTPDIAPQKTLSESVVCPPLKKRHGGALPS